MKTRAIAKTNIPAIQIAATMDTCTPNRVMCETVVANATKTDGGVMFAAVPLCLIDVDLSYQRKEGHYKKIAAEWDENRAGTLLVSYRDDRFYVVDGLNRCRAALMNGVERLYCLIRLGWTQADEAKAFNDQDQNKKRLSGYDHLRSGIIARETPALLVQEACERHGVIYRPTRSNQRGSLTAFSTAIKMCADSGNNDTLSSVFELVRAMHWTMENRAYSRTVLIAGRNVIEKFGAAAALEYIPIYGAGKSLADHMKHAWSKYPSAENGTQALTNLWNEVVGNSCEIFENKS